MQPPSGFDEAFLVWFRDATESAWASHRPRTFDDYVADGVGGADWQRGTRWTRDLTDGDIDDLERSWGLRFPPDYRLFLRHLHATDRPRLGAAFDGNVLVPVSGPGVYHWRRDAAQLRDALDRVLDGILFDVEHGVLWPAGWGPRPATAEERERVVRAQVAAAPRLAPILAHRALVLEPCVAGNPVLSVHQTDIIVYGGDLRSYLLTEFATLLGLPRRWDGASRPVPFWLDLE